ncbi:hypothetical protein Tco_1190431, partial [Tanacetum coccineum]
MSSKSNSGEGDGKDDSNQGAEQGNSIRGVSGVDENGCEANHILDNSNNIKLTQPQFTSY